jgi:hypothetical protein
MLVLRASIALTTTRRRQDWIKIMRNIPVDITNMQLMATGSVQPVPVWNDGKPVENQQAKDDFGAPLWNVELMIPPAAGDPRSRMENFMVRVAAYQPPVLAFGDVPQIKGLVVSCSVNKRSGALTQYWSAQEIASVSAPKS